MSSHTPNDPTQKFDFDNIEVITEAKDKLATYDPEKIAANVIWPLVDAKWDGDFRQDSLPTMQHFVLPKVGTYQGRLLEVTLSAGCEVDWKDEDQEDSSVYQQVLVYDAAIRIDESTPDKMEYLLGIFKQRQPERWDELIDADTGEPHFDMHAITGFCIYLDTFGGVSSRAFYALKDEDGIEIWSTDDDEVDSDGERVDFYNDDDEPIFEGPDPLTPSGEPLYKEDIDMLLTASAILNAPEDVVGYLYKIRRFPEVQ